MASRRTILGGIAAAPLVVTAGTLAVGPGPAHGGWLVFNAGFDRARLAALRAERLGWSVSDTGGELAALLLQRGSELPARIVGITGYAELVLAKDILRGQGRKVRQILQFGAAGGRAGALPEESGTAGEIARLVRPLPQARPSRATGFVWQA